MPHKCIAGHAHRTPSRAQHTRPATAPAQQPAQTKRHHQPKTNRTSKLKAGREPKWSAAVMVARPGDCYRPRCLAKPRNERGSLRVGGGRGGYWLASHPR